jgi:rhodanese-related sulfurtransferase
MEQRMLCRNGRVGAVRLALAILLAGSPAALAACSQGDDAPSVSVTTASPDATVEGAYATVDVRAAYDGLEADPSAQIVDVREPDEWASTGVAPDAVLIPLGQLQQRGAAELDADRPVYVICRSGNRSREGSAILVGLGFVDVSNVAGGMNDWAAAGLPIEPYVDSGSS